MTVAGSCFESPTPVNGYTHRVKGTGCRVQGSKRLLQVGHQVQLCEGCWCGAHDLELFFVQLGVHRSQKVFGQQYQFGQQDQQRFETQDKLQHNDMNVGQEGRRR